MIYKRGSTKRKKTFARPLQWFGNAANLFPTMFVSVRISVRIGWIISTKSAQGISRMIASPSEKWVYTASGEGMADGIGNRSGHSQDWFVKGVFVVPASTPRDRENPKKNHPPRSDTGGISGLAQGSVGLVLCITPPYHHRISVLAPRVCAVTLLTVHTDPVRLI